MAVNTKIPLKTPVDVTFPKLLKTRRRQCHDTTPSSSISRSDSAELTPKVPSFLAKKASKGSRFRSFYEYDGLTTPLSSVGPDKNKHSSSSSSGVGTLSDVSSTSSSNSYSGILSLSSIKTNLFRNTSQILSLSKQHYLNVRNDSKISIPPRGLPSLGWVDGRELWSLLVDNETKYARDSNYFRRQREITPHSRKILVGWMIEVCELYNLGLDTFYYSIDYVDRYLSVVDSVPLCSLQLLGTTALFIASKLLEVSPLGINDFVHLTDGACSIEDVLIQEGIILNELNWNLTPFSPMNWLELFLHIACVNNSISNKNIDNINYKGPLTRMRSLRAMDSAVSDKIFVNIKIPRDKMLPLLKYLEFIIQDSNSLCFSYSVIAASIIHLMTDFDVYEVTGIGFLEISACVKWIRQNFYQNKIENTMYEHGDLLSKTPMKLYYQDENYKDSLKEEILEGKENSYLDFF